MTRAARRRLHWREQSVRRSTTTATAVPVEEPHPFLAARFNRLALDGLADLDLANADRLAADLARHGDLDLIRCRSTHLPPAAATANLGLGLGDSKHRQHEQHTQGQHKSLHRSTPSGLNFFGTPVPQLIGQLLPCRQGFVHP